jgi:hypothetical protein
MENGKGTTLAILVGVWATFALDVFSTFTSSPQTTEINASTRADTLMKWVGIAAVVAVGGGLAGSLSSKRWIPLLVTGFVAFGMWQLYEHAKKKGLASDAAGTEG